MSNTCKHMCPNTNVSLSLNSDNTFTCVVEQIYFNRVFSAPTERTATDNT